MPNFSTSLFNTTAPPGTHNRFDPLSSLSEPASPIPVSATIFGYYSGAMIILLTCSFTIVPSPVNRGKAWSPIGKAYHDIVYVEYDINARSITIDVQIRSALKAT